MKIENIKNLTTWFLLVFTILIVLGTIHEIRTCDGKLVKGLFWWECIPDKVIK